MTAIVAKRIPGIGCAMACDSRLTDSDSSTILSDAFKKYFTFPSGACMVAGTIPATWGRTQAAPPKSLEALLDWVIDQDEDDQPDFLIYDRRSDRLFYSETAVVEHTAAIGAGGPVALGALRALPPTKSLDVAAAQVRSAVNIAIGINASCGGRARVVVVPKRGKIKVL